MFARPTLTELRQLVAEDLAASLPGSDPLLRFSNLRIIGVMLAGMANQQYGYLDWIARESVPFTATDEFLYAWGALKDVFLKAATKAGDVTTGGAGSVQFTGSTPGTQIPAFSLLVRPTDGVQYKTTAVGTVDGGGNVTVPAECITEGAAGNCDVGTAITLGQSIPGVQSNGLVTVALTGGADLETQDEFRTRMLEVYRAPPQGGSHADYVKWATEVAGVTRAWCIPNGMGPGTVIVYFMEDDARSAFNGFPQGTNGVATGEDRDLPATGDQLVVANYIFSRQPVTALVYACAPIASPTAFTISGIADVDVRAAIAQAIDDVFLQNGSPGGTVNLLDIEAGIAAIPGSDGAVVTVPAANIVAAAGHLSTRGVITWI